MIKTERQNDILNQSFIISTFILSAFPIMTFGMRSVFMIIWTFLGVLNCVKNRDTADNKTMSIYLLIAISPFVYLTFSLFYTLDLDSGIKRLIQMLPLLICPLVFYLNKEKFNQRLILTIAWVFSISVIVFVFYQIFYSLLSLDYLLDEVSGKELRLNNLQDKVSLSQDVLTKLKTRRFRNFILELTQSHFTYQGIWIVFSIFFLGYNFLKFSHKLKYLILPVIFLLLVWLFFISARMPLITLFLSTITVLLISRIKGKVIIMVSSIALLILIASYFAFSPLKVRVNEVFNSKIELPTSGDDIENYNSMSVRYGIYYCSFNIITNNLLLGVGVGDSQNELNSCYTDKIGAKIYTWTDYNTHNQYLYFLLATGVVGFILYLLLIYTNFKKAFTSGNILYLFFILIISFISLTENIFLRSDGVMFFSLFSGLFLFNLRKP